MWQWPSYCHKISLHLKVCFQTLTTYVGSSWCSVLITPIIGVSGGVVTFLSQYIGYDCHQVIFLPSSE